MLTQLYLRGRVLLVFALFPVIGLTAFCGHAVNRTTPGTVTDPSGTAIRASVRETFRVA
jgi:hypothetical protein